jgi:hypothetical protein
MTNQADIVRGDHHRAVRFFWGLLIGATTVSLLGNIAHAVLPHLPRVAVQIGAAAVPPIGILAAVHGIGLAVRAGASGRVYCWAVTATAAIGAGAFAVSFLALRDLMLAIGYTPATAWAFPAIVDTAVAVSTLMLLALGDKPVRRARSTTTSTSAQDPPSRCLARNAKQEVPPIRSAQSARTGGAGRPGKCFAPVQLDSAQTLRSAQAEEAQGDADLAAELIASGVTTQSPDTVIGVLSARRNGASINAAAKSSGINYRTAQRIVEAAVDRHPPGLAAVG